MRKTPRGIRNNNPGNIDFNKRTKWQGQVGIEKGVPNPRFIEFESPEMGIRALARLLITYHDKHKLNTISLIINRYAPKQENNTRAYINKVAKDLGITADEPFSVKDFHYAFPLVKAIIHHENGIQPYSDEVIVKGLELAGISSSPIPRKNPSTRSVAIVAASAGAGIEVANTDNLAFILDIMKGVHPFVAGLGGGFMAGMALVAAIYFYLRWRKGV